MNKTFTRVVAIVLAACMILSVVVAAIYALAAEPSSATLTMVNTGEGSTSTIAIVVGAVALLAGAGAVFGPRFLGK